MKKNQKKISDFVDSNLTTQTVWDVVHVAAETDDDVLSCGSGHGSHRQQINWAESKIHSSHFEFVPFFFFTNPYFD